MATLLENAGMAAETEPVGLFTEGAVGIATIVLAIVALAGVSSVTLAAIATIVIGVGLMAQAFNTAAENLRLPAAAVADFGGEVMVDCLAGGTGIVLGVLALIGINPQYLMPAALIVFGGALLLSGALEMRTRTLIPALLAEGEGRRMLTMPGSAAASGMEVLMGIAAVVLGILSLLMTESAVLLLVGYITVGAALLTVSATFGAALMSVLATPAATE